MIECMGPLRAGQRWGAVALALVLGSTHAMAAPAVPDFATGPPMLAVTPFENHAGGKGLDWLVAGAPFELAEKAQGVVDVDIVGGPLIVPGEQIPAMADTVAAFAHRQGASFVATGWFDRVGEQIRLDVIVWKVAVPGQPVATVAAEAQRSGDPKRFDALLGDVMTEVWATAGLAPGLAADATRIARLHRVLAPDSYPVELMGRGLGELTGALGGTVDLKAAQHDLERATFIAPKLYEAQRLYGEVLARSGDGKQAASKINYALDLAPDDDRALRAAANVASDAGKWELAVDLLSKLVTHRPWDLDARDKLGAALWQVGEPAAAAHQLEQVTQRLPDQLSARRVLALIHASRGDTGKLVAELEAIAARAPADLDVKADLASAYGALGKWADATKALELVAAARPSDVALAIRVGDGHRKSGDVAGALEWYARAGKLAPTSSLPAFAAAQTLLDAGKRDDAERAYAQLVRSPDVRDAAAAEATLGALAVINGHAADAIAHLTRAAKAQPRSVATRRWLAAAELAAGDPAAALTQLEPALVAWPSDAGLHYLAGVAHAQSGDPAAARAELAAALVSSPGDRAARAALSSLDSGAKLTLALPVPPDRSWGDAEAIAGALDRFDQIAATMAIVRAAYQGYVLSILGVLGKGPDASPTAAKLNGCPVTAIASWWANAQAALDRYERLGIELEAQYRFVVRHDELGLTAGLLPNARTQVSAAKKSFALALADVGELRAEWSRQLGPELRIASCTDRLLAAAVADPAHYHVIVEDTPPPIPKSTAPRAAPHATFYVDNTQCKDGVDVWVDGAELGQVDGGKRGSLVAPVGERTLCLLGNAAQQCGDRGTVRQVYLHDGWTVTLQCPN